MNKMLRSLAGSLPLQALLTLMAYGFYALLLGVSLAPSVYLVWRGWIAFMTTPSYVHVLFFSIACGGALYLYFITGTLVMAIALRVLSLGIKPGNYPFVSLTMVRWMIYSGVYHLAGSTILVYVPMSFLGIVFFRIFGAKIGKNVILNSWFLNDAFLMEIGDNVVIGGKTDLSCHTIEGDTLILQPLKIGANTLIGQHCYISPGVTIGKKCVIGQYAFIRKNKTIPDGAIISAIAGMPIREVANIEKSAHEKPDGSL